MSAALELISFKVCPFVQRSTILLNDKGVDYQTTYIDLADKPDWFLAISPMGKVPVLKVDDTVVFESAVIAEYLDEVYPPSAHPADPLLKAQNRAVIEFTSQVLMKLWAYCNQYPTEQQQEAEQALQAELDKLEGYAPEQDFFNGQLPQFIDLVSAPLLWRLQIVAELGLPGIYQQRPKLQNWSHNVLGLEAVKASMVNEVKPYFEDLMQLTEKA